MTIAASLSPRRGEIWYAFMPGQPDDPHQPRPGLVISENVRNRRTDDLIIIVPIFSEGRPGPTRLAVAAGVGGLRHDSMLFCDELTTIDRDFLVRGPLGPLVPDALLERIVGAILIAVGGSR